MANEPGPASASDPELAAPGLYVHLPFCGRICPYCDFAVLRGGPAAKQRFVDHLIAEATGWGTSARGAPDLGTSAATSPEDPRWRWPHPEPFDTVYLGGGTPSELPEDELARLLAALRSQLPIAADAWISLEANPEDVTATRCAAWRALGVQSLSLGVQSFRDDELRFLGRSHDGAGARAAVSTALDAGFPIVSVDLIFGLPGQSEQALADNVGVLAALGPQHVSGYQLTIHQGTSFGFRHARGQLAELPEGEQAALFRRLHRALGDRGFAPYEVSNFARAPQFRSRHNRKYWRHVPYLGLGPSAHSLAWPAGAPAATTGQPSGALPFDPGGERSGLANRPAATRSTNSAAAVRFWNERKTPPWERRIATEARAVVGSEHLGPRELGLEALLLGLRTVDGVDLARLHALTGVDLAATNQALIEQLITDQLLDASRLPDQLALTLAGLAVADGLAAAFRLEVAE